MAFITHKDSGSNEICFRVQKERKVLFFSIIEQVFYIWVEWLHAKKNRFVFSFSQSAFCKERRKNLRKSSEIWDLTLDAEKKKKKKLW